MLILLKLFTGKSLGKKYETRKKNRFRVVKKANYFKYNKC